MLKRYGVMAALLAGLLLTVSVTHADNPSKKVNLKGIKCLICNMQVSETSSADYKGAKVYFGCPACPPRFKKDTAKYTAKANAQLVATKQARQKACPMMGKPCNKDVKLTVAGADVTFCCAKCKTAVSKLKGDAQIEKVFNDKAFAKGFEVPKKSK